MPRHREGHWRERRWPWITAGYVVLFAVVAALTSFIYDSAAPANRPVAIRLAVGFLLAVVLIHLRSYFRGDPRWSSLGDPPSALDNALLRQPATPRLDAGFVKLRDEVANSLASRSYCEKVLWPRLGALLRARGQPCALPLPAARRWLGRGPSRRTLAAAIERIAGPRTDQR